MSRGRIYRPSDERKKQRQLEEKIAAKKQLDNFGTDKLRLRKKVLQSLIEDGMTKEAEEGLGDLYGRTLSSDELMSLTADYEMDTETAFSVYEVENTPVKRRTEPMGEVELQQFKLDAAAEVAKENRLMAQMTVEERSAHIFRKSTEQLAHEDVAKAEAGDILASRAEIINELSNLSRIAGVDPLLTPVDRAKIKKALATALDSEADQIATLAMAKEAIELPETRLRQQHQANVERVDAMQAELDQQRIEFNLDPPTAEPVFDWNYKHPDTGYNPNYLADQAKRDAAKAAEGSTDAN